MALRRPKVLVGGKEYELPADDSLPLEVRKIAGDLEGQVVIRGESFPGLKLEGTDGAAASNAPVSLEGSGVAVDGDTIFVEFNGAGDGYYLRLGPAITLDDGRTVRPLEAIDIGFDAHAQTSSDAAAYSLSSGAETDITGLDITANTDYQAGTTAELFLRVEETGNNSTLVRVRFYLQSVEVGFVDYTIPGGSVTPIFIARAMTTLPQNGELVEISAEALQTGGGRNTQIRGDIQASTLKLIQPGLSVDPNDQPIDMNFNLLSRARVTNYSFNGGAPTISAGALDLDIGSNGNSFLCDITENVTAFSLSNAPTPAQGQRCVVRADFTQAGAGGFSIDWGVGTMTDWGDETPPTLGTTVGDELKVVFESSTGGAPWAAAVWWKKTA